MNLSRRMLFARTGIGSAVTAGVLSAACALPAPNGFGLGQRTPLAQRAPATLEFWGGPNAEQRTAQVAAWNAKYPNVKVNFRTAAAIGAGVEALRTFAAHVAAGTAPHVVDFDRFQVAAYVNWRIFGPLDDHVKRDKIDLAAFFPATLGEATGLDKHLYGLPSSVDNRMLYWNKRTFAEAGLDPAKPPATWDELQETAVRLTRRGSGGLERLGIHTEEGQATLHLFAWQNGGGFLTPDGRKVTLALPQNVEALERMVALMRAQAAWDEITAFRAGWSQEQGHHPFLTGTLPVQYQINNWAGEIIARHRPELEFGVAAPPARRAGEKSLTWSGGFSYSISRNVRDPEVGWELIKWLLSEESWTVAYEHETARARAAGGVYLPGMTGQPSLDNKMYAKYRTGLPSVDRVPEVAVELMQHTRFRDPCIAAADLWEGIARAQHEAVLQGKPAGEALEEQNSRVQRALDQAWIFAPRT